MGRARSAATLLVRYTSSALHEVLIDYLLTVSAGDEEAAIPGLPCVGTSVVPPTACVYCSDIVHEFIVISSGDHGFFLKYMSVMQFREEHSFSANL